jgi:glycosyltransferase involved in cell wall biosynthesis
VPRDLPIDHAAQAAGQVPTRICARDGRPPARGEIAGDPVRRRASAGRPADIRIDHIGEALDPALGAAAQATMAAVPNYRWLGGLPHEEVRRRIQRAHVLIHCSRMEGGAHVIMEAVASGTPVLASRIDGNVGMLGADYGGYFPPGDARRWRHCCCAARTVPAATPKVGAGNTAMSCWRR